MISFKNKYLLSTLCMFFLVGNLHPSLASAFPFLNKSSNKVVHKFDLLNEINEVNILKTVQKQNPDLSVQDLESTIKEGILEHETNQKKIATLDFNSIEKSLLSNISLDSYHYTNTEYGILNELEKKERPVVYNYEILSSEKLLNKNDFLHEKNQSINKADKIKKIIKMQKLARYISETYKVSLRDAENIVYNTFVEAHKKGLDPLLILSIISVESTFKKQAKSHAGAVGLTQVMERIHRKRINENKVDIWSVNGNIKIGTDILKEYLNLSKGNTKRALQMYNGSLKDKKYKYSNKVLKELEVFKVALNTYDG